MSTENSQEQSGAALLTGSNSELIQFRVPKSYYDALQVLADGQKANLPDILRRSVWLLIFPYAIRMLLKEDLKGINRMKFEELMAQSDSYKAELERVQKSCEVSHTAVSGIEGETQRLKAEFEDLSKQLQDRWKARQGEVNEVVEAGLTESERRALRRQERMRAQRAKMSPEQIKRQQRMLSPLIKRARPSKEIEVKAED